MGDGGRVGGFALLVDDHPLFRVGFGVAWRRSRPREPLKTVADLATARGLVRPGLRLVVLDLLLPDGIGLDLASSLVHHGVPFVMLSTADAPAIVEAARRCGAAAFLSKELDPDLILQEIDRVLRDPTTGAFPAHADLPHLSSRERDVLAGLLAGHANREIAAQLGVGVETVKTHVTSLLVELGVADRFEAVRAARDLGLDIALPYLGEQIRSLTP
jgi:DNA-binding NarL/FixJ family response regulator